MALKLKQSLTIHSVYTQPIRSFFPLFVFFFVCFILFDLLYTAIDLIDTMVSLIIDFAFHH